VGLGFVRERVVARSARWFAAALVSLAGAYALVSCTGDEGEGGLPSAPTGAPSALDLDAGPSAPGTAMMDSGTSLDVPIPTQIAPDAGDTCEVEQGSCNLVGDCGCGQGQTCAAGPEFVPECRAVAATALAAYASCTYDEECPAGHSCIGRACKRHCADAADCGWSNAECVSVVNAETDEPVAGFSFCGRNCDLLNPQQPRSGFQSCGALATCLVYDFPFVPDCIGYSGSGGVGSLCDSDGLCAPGHYCDSANFCQRWCEVGAELCAPGSKCTGFSVPLRVAGSEMGGCICDPGNGKRCDPVSNCGCHGSDVCGFYNVDLVPACSPRFDTPVAPYTACDGDDSCPARHACIGGICSPLCNTEADCVEPGATCFPVFAGEGNTDPIPGFNFCTRPCDPAQPHFAAGALQACEPGVHCVPLTDSVLSCLFPEGSGVAGSACTSLLDCGPALFCSNEGRCERWCHVASNECGGESCVGFGTPLVISGSEVGVCVPSALPDAGAF
jgi:hypothetical protein